MSHLPNINAGIIGKICAACRHQRKASDRAPRHRCPNCGEAYFISERLELSKERLYYDYAKTIHLPEGNEIAFVVNKLRVSDDLAENRPSSSQSRRVFFEWMRKTINLGRNEHILIVLGVLQYLTIGLFFALWLKGFTLTSTILTSLLMFDILFLVSIWTPLCIYLAALPMSVISACMACVHFLHQQGTTPSIKLCLSIVLPNIRDIWRLQWWDSKAALWRFGSANL